MNPAVSSSTLLLAANFAVFGHLQETFLSDVETGVSTSPVFDQRVLADAKRADGGNRDRRSSQRAT